MKASIHPLPPCCFTNLGPLFICNRSPQSLSKPCRADDTSLQVMVHAAGSSDPSGRPLSSLTWALVGSSQATLAGLVAAANAG